MAIDPLILVPAAAGAVVIVILFIWLVTGTRTILLTPESLSAFLADQEPGENIVASVISSDRKFALVRWEDGIGIGLVRSFGNKPVLQMLGLDVLKKCDWRAERTILYIPRQGFVFPPVKFTVDTADREKVGDILNGVNDAAA